MTLKKHIVLQFANLLSNEKFNDYKLILTTSGGTIAGNICLESDFADDNSFNASLSLICDTAYSIRRKELNLSDDESLPDDEGYLIIKDVQILSERPITLPSMIVFYNEIIGVSIGKIS